MRFVEVLFALRARSLIAGAGALLGVMCVAAAANAVPVLQVGAPAGPGDTGTYADYQGSSSDPTEDDTAVTDGGTIYVAGVYGPNTLNLGGQFSTGDNWSDFGLPDTFDTHDAVLLVSVPDGSLAAALAALTVNGLSAFYSSEDQSFFPNDHDPVKDAIADFLFFDIGEFDDDPNAVPDFDTETGSADGEILTLLIAGFEGLDWLHFDAMALETSSQGQTNVVTSLENNPGSHDVTLKPEDGGPDGEIDVPEPASLTLLGAGLAGLGLLLRRRKRA